MRFVFYACERKEKSKDIVAMISLETVDYYFDEFAEIAEISATPQLDLPPSTSDFIDLFSSPQ